MSRVSFANFGHLADAGVSWTEMAGRYSFQALNEPRIVADVADKLQLDSNDTLLEIGCGAGNLLVPLAGLVRVATGIDHPNLLRKLGDRCQSIRRIPGNFLDFQPAELFSKILIYSVLHYLADEAELTQFVMKATGLLGSEGLLLIGDVANVDKKRVFEMSPQSQEFLRDWRRQPRQLNTGPNPDPDKVTINDGIITRLQAQLKSSGFDLVKLQQPEGLPMCYTREDLLVSHANR